MTVERTKGPWTRSCFQVYGADGSRIAHTGMGQLPPSRSSESEANAAAIVHWENNFEPMRKALALALCYLLQFEPGDSRAVSNEFVAMQAVLSGDTSGEVMPIIEAALAVAEREAGLCEDEGCSQHGTPHVCVDASEAMAKTIWLAEFTRAFNRAPSDPWENQDDDTKNKNRNTARKLIEAGFGP